jgi:hypothetical protein
MWPSADRLEATDGAHGPGCVPLRETQPCRDPDGSWGPGNQAERLTRESEPPVGRYQRCENHTERDEFGGKLTHG